MTRTRRSRPRDLAIQSVASAALGTLPLHRAPRPLRAAMVWGPAVLTAGVMARALLRGPAEPRPVDADVDADGDADARRPEAEGVPATDPAEEVEAWTRPPLAMVVLMPLAFGGLVGAASAAGIRADRWVEETLRRNGAPAPRLIIGAASGVLVTGLTLLEERVEDRDDADGAEGPGAAGDA